MWADWGGMVKAGELRERRKGLGGVGRKSWGWGGPFLESLFWVQALHPGIGGPPYRDRLWVRVWPFPNFCPESWSF